MKLIYSFLLISTINISSYFNVFINSPPELIDALLLSYDAMYSNTIVNNKENEFIILDMESIFWVDTTYEERQKVINHFEKYNKTVVSASLFKLQEMGLADNLGQIKLNGSLFMINDITSSNNELYIKGSRWYGPLSAEFFLITFQNYNNSWNIKEIQSLGVS